MRSSPPEVGTTSPAIAAAVAAAIGAVCALAAAFAFRVGGLPARAEATLPATLLSLLAVVAAPAAAFALATRVAPRVPGWLAGGLSAAAGALVMLVAIAAVSPVRHVLADARPDLLAIAVAAGLALFVRGRLARPLQVAAAGVAIGVVAAGVVRVLYGSITGAAPTPDLLAYFMANLGDVLPVVASEAHPGRLALIVLPAVALPLIAVVARRRAGHEPRRVQAGWPLAALAATLLVVPGSNGAGGSSSVGLVAQAVRSPAACEAEGAGGRVQGAEGSSQLAASSLQLPPFERPVFANVAFVAGQRTRPLNVVVLLLESFRSMSVTPAEGESAAPFVAGLLRRGVRVPELYAAVTHTNKALGPILAGAYAYPRPPYLETEATIGRGLPDLLRPHGYRSAFFTPATLAFERKDRILRHLGFDEARGDGSFDAAGFAETNYFGHEDRIIVTPILEWVDRQQDSGRPFMLTVLTLATHHPYTVPGHAAHDVEGRLDDYHAAMRYTDGVVRDLFAGFESRGLLGNTVFVVLGDHGEAFGEHGMWQHSHVVYDEVLHVPGVIIAPGLEAGVAAGPRSTIDVVPTVADVLGFELRGTLPGRSLLAPVSPTRTIYGAAWNGREASVLRRGSIKYVVRDGRPVEVYDTRADPGETRDLTVPGSSSGQAVHPDTLAGVVAELAAWRAAVEAAWVAAACE